MMPDRVVNALTAAQVAAGSGAVVISFSSIDLILKILGAIGVVLAFIVAQWWSWRRDVRERKQHAMEMEMHRVLMDKHVREQRLLPETDGGEE